MPENFRKEAVLSEIHTVRQTVSNKSVKWSGSEIQSEPNHYFFENEINPLARFGEMRK